MTRFLVIFVIALIILIIVWPYLNRLGLGRPVSAVAVERPLGKLYIIVATCLVLSVLLSGLMWWFGR